MKRVRVLRPNRQPVIVWPTGETDKDSAIVVISALSYFTDRQIAALEQAHTR